MSTFPQVLALDVDGTIVDGLNEMTDAVREAVMHARKVGAEIVITTGRSIHGVLDAASNLGLDEGIAVASNGAVVFEFDATGTRVLHTVTFDAREVVHRVLERLPDAMVAVEEIGVGFRINQRFPDGDINGQMTVQSIDELVAEPVTRVILRSPEHSAAEFADFVADIGLHGINYFIGYSSWLDLAPLGVSKASGLQFIVERLDLDAADVLAIGDGHNDLEMLEWAGRGVAMGHAPERLRAVADDVTGAIDEDGVVSELAKHFPR